MAVVRHPTALVQHGSRRILTTDGHTRAPETGGCLPASAW